MKKRNKHKHDMPKDKTKLPIGTVVSNPMNFPAHDGCLIPDGREISRLEYPELYTIIGETFGKGNGSTTFNLPTLEGHVIVAKQEQDNRQTMNWTEPKPPTKDESYYDHTICETPLGKFKIEWKGWKQHDSYNVMLDDKWVGNDFDLESAKKIAKEYLIEKHAELTKFLNI